MEIIGREEKAPGQAFIQIWSAKQRLRRAFTSLAIFWGLAILSIAIPILHFLLVPFFFLLGLLALSMTYARKSIVLGGKGICPCCAKNFEIARAADIWPLKDICTHCHEHVRIIKSIH